MKLAVRETDIKEVVTIEEVPVIKLTLTEEQAKVFYAFTGQIGGSTTLSYRAIMSPLRAALEDVGISSSWYDFFDTRPSITASYRSN